MTRQLGGKNGAAFLWTLLECVFFSGVVLGWTWLTLIFRADHYLLGNCNTTDHGLTSLLPVLISATPTNLPTAAPQLTLARRRCRPKRKPTLSSGSSPYHEAAVAPIASAIPSADNLDLTNTAGTSQAARTVTYPRSEWRRVLPWTGSDGGVVRPVRAAQTPVTMLHLLEKGRDVKTMSSRRQKFRQDDVQFVEHFSDEERRTGEERSGVDVAHTAKDTATSRVDRPRSAASLSMPPETASSPSGHEGWRAMEDKEAEGCVEQRETLRLMLSAVAVLRDLCVLPVGIFLDKYGTTRTRLLTVLIFAVGTLMMTFTSADVPWLMLPALTLTGVAGVAVLLTNVQIANLLVRRRHLMISLYCGASLSSGFITNMMQLSHQNGVDIQTSFMFLTIGLVPLLVSTVAFLPKTRVPWPLPPSYGIRRSQSLDENLLRRQKEWKRRLKEAGVNKVRRPIPKFWSKGGRQMLLGVMLWYGVQSLHSAQLETILVDVGHWKTPLGSDLEHVFGWIQLLSLPLAVFPGMFIDRRSPTERRRDTGMRQMQKLVVALLVSPLLALAERAVVIAAEDTTVSLFVLSYILHVLHRVWHLTTVFCFLLHVHFAQEHCGKYITLTLFASGVVSAFQFPMRVYLHHQPLVVNATIMTLLTMALGHALLVWHRCRRGLIRDHPDRTAFRYLFCPPELSFPDSPSYRAPHAQPPLDRSHPPGSTNGQGGGCTQTIANSCCCPGHLTTKNGVHHQACGSHCREEHTFHFQNSPACRERAHNSSDINEQDSQNSNQRAHNSSDINEHDSQNSSQRAQNSQDTNEQDSQNSFDCAKNSSDRSQRAQNNPKSNQRVHDCPDSSERARNSPSRGQHASEEEVRQ